MVRQGTCTSVAAGIRGARPQPGGVSGAAGRGVSAPTQKGCHSAGAQLVGRCSFETDALVYQCVFQVIPLQSPKLIEVGTEGLTIVSGGFVKQARLAHKGCTDYHTKFRVLSWEAYGLKA